MTMQGENQATVTAIPRRKLPGKPKPAADALRAYNEANAERRKRVDRMLWDFWAPDPDGYYRWRIQLSCGHIREVLVWGKDELPLDGWKTTAHTGIPGRYVTVKLPAGHAACEKFGRWYENQPYREVTAWTAREVREFPADPVDPPDGEDPELWAKTRRAEPHSTAFWEVALSCGHVTTSLADPDWKPEDGISYRIHPDNPDEMRRRDEFLAYPDADGDTKHRFEQMLPSPHSDEQCEFCARDREITAYELTGPLVPSAPARWAPDPRAALQRRIAAAARLRDHLAALDNDGEG